MKTTYWMTLLIAGAAMAVSPVANGKGKGKGKPAATGKAKPNKGGGKQKKPNKAKPQKTKGNPGKGKGGNNAKEWRKSAKFADKDRKDLVSHWDRYKGNTKGLPPGLAKNVRNGKPLPPGWEKKIGDGWIIEDDWWPLFHRVPAANLPQGLRLPSDTGMFLFGDRMVRIHEPSREVIDVVRLPGIRL